MHIDNLYKKPQFLDQFKRVYCLEKIYGTSAYIKFSPDGITFFSGGASHAAFVKLFNVDQLLTAYKSLCNNTTYVIYGEAYGGEMQGMSDIYGKELKFIAFDVSFSNSGYKAYFMDVPEAEKFVNNVFGLEFVWYMECCNNLEDLNICRDMPSKQSFRNMGTEGESEGIIIRPIYESMDKFGDRWIVKHKRDKFRETTSVRKVNPDKIEVINSANEFANEYITDMRLSYILDKFPQPHDITITGKVVAAMIEDVKREMVSGEIEWAKDVEKAIGRKTTEIYKRRFSIEKFDVSAVLTITTGRLLTYIDNIYNIVEWMTNDCPYTHQLGRFSEECKPVLLERFQELRGVNKKYLNLLDMMIADSSNRFTTVNEWLRYVCNECGLKQEYEIEKINES